jgi:16S rRNA (uracil1498-N3)-methyltransferase
MNRFFADFLDEGIAVLNKSDYQHCKNVLRLKVDSEIFAVFEGKEYIAKITAYEDGLVKCKIIKETAYHREADVKINLFQCIPKGSKMEVIIQKNVEIGVFSITPVISDRTIVKISERKKELSKVERWRKISEEAAKQSMRNLIPEIKSIISFKEMLQNLYNSKGMIIVPYEEEKSLSLKNIDIKQSEINLIIGPEGGFEPYEIEELKKINAHVVSLGPRILRTETAAMVASAVLMYKTNNL